MNKYVVLGVNENPKYLYYLPLIRWAWKQFGWDTIVFSNGDPWGLAKPHIDYYPLKKINGYSSATLAQVSRLYACCVTENDDDFIMTSDVDMLPLSNYWLAVQNTPTTWGRDLTDYHYPICYIGMASHYWAHTMNLSNYNYQEMIERDLDRVYPKSKNKWCVDQDLITENLLLYHKKSIIHINRGTDKRTGYPIGRVDRSHWTLDHKQFIDAHLPHDILTNEKSFHNVMQLLHTVWPKEDWKWFINYTKEFKKLL